jgi:hypothetical protein
VRLRSARRVVAKFRVNDKRSHGDVALKPEIFSNLGFEPLALAADVFEGFLVYQYYKK